MNPIFTRRSFVATSSAIPVFLIAGSMTSCGKPDHVPPKKKVDTTALFDAMHQLVVDLDEYDLNDEMLDYSSAVNRYSNLCHDPNATQREVDEAVSDISRLRRIAIDSFAPPPAESVAGVTYDEFVSMAPDSIGKRYMVEGSVTWVMGSFDADHWELTVRWNDSDAPHECVTVRVDHEHYRSDCRKYFVGNCIFFGFDERTSVPVFVCDTDYEGR